MRVARTLTAITIVTAVAMMPAWGQGFGDLLKKKLKEKVEQTTTEATSKTVDAAADKAGKKEAPAPDEPSGQQDTPAADSAAGAGSENLKPGEGAWANYDFKPGSKVLFADDFTADEVGDFPRRLELVSGTMEIVDWQKSRWLRLTSTSKFQVPLGGMLPQRYTMEFDFAVPAGEMWIYPDGKEDGGILVFRNGGVAGVGGEGPQAQSQENVALKDKVVHARVMADGKYVKLYVNDKRLANIPNFDPARGNKVLFFVDAREQLPALFGNFRIAEGGKKLYDVLAEKGRVATQGIYFDTGSARIRPESTPTLKEIGTMLQEHGDLRLTIEGHTDNVGSAAANQTLSESRANAVRTALMENYGIDGGRLTGKGFGSSKPATSNDTTEGRQNNRRVELVKL
jgi:outer membrane protein OmpA-like peptidoglycan-associated protein